MNGKGRPAGGGLTDVSTAHSTAPSAKEWWSHAELADWLGLTERALHWLNYTGAGPERHKIAGKLRYRKPAIESWLATRVVA